MGKRKPKVIVEHLKANKPVDSVGRPAKFDNALVTVAYNLCLLGCGNEEIASVCGIALSTLHEWIHSYPQFSDALTRGKTLADANVAAALYNAAIGGKQPQQKPFVTQDGGVYIVDYMETIPANVTAMKMWLTNRQPNLWSEKSQIEHSGTMDITMNLNGADAGGANEEERLNEIEDVDFDDLDDYQESDLADDRI